MSPRQRRKLPPNKRWQSDDITGWQNQILAGKTSQPKLAARLGVKPQRVSALIMTINYDEYKLLREVRDLVGKQKTDQEIAEALGIPAEEAGHLKIRLAERQRQAADD